MSVSCREHDEWILIIGIKPSGPFKGFGCFFESLEIELSQALVIHKQGWRSGVKPHGRFNIGQCLRRSVRRDQSKSCKRVAPRVAWIERSGLLEFRERIHGR